MIVQSTQQWKVGLDSFHKSRFDIFSFLKGVCCEEIRLHHHKGTFSIFHRRSNNAKGCYLSVLRHSRIPRSSLGITNFGNRNLNVEVLWCLVKLRVLLL